MALRKMLMMAITAVIIVCLFLTLATSGVLGVPRGVGKVIPINVNLYSDSGCTINCTSVNWGNIYPGSVIQKTVYVKNSGDTAVTIGISTNSWNPKWAKSLVTLSWNLSNYLLSTREVVPATLTLASVSNTGSLTNFNFIIVITGTQK
jgi:hypothetical protein